METITTQVQLDPIQFQALAEESQKRQLSLNELLQDLIRRYFANLSPAIKPNNPDHTSLIGLGDSGATDVSECHDRYLGEALANEHLH